jgi:hypothetical protein
VFIPAVEESAQKIAILLRRYRKIGYLARHGVNFNTRNKLKILDAKLNKKIKKHIGIFHIFVIEQRERIECNIVLFT